tara:strand:- start:1032 stop:1631 length:600 start_codon:yes stop_codon:yes gene_type:complete
MIVLFSVVPYYYNPNIHNLGNIGIGGKVHATIAPIARRVIDLISYKGVNIRQEIMSEYSETSVLDLCCGIGESTVEFGTGIDTSPEMIHVAKFINKNSDFHIGNAETYKPKLSYDIVTCMFAFHEMPLEAQYKVIDNAIKIAKKEVIIVDIASIYQPKEVMLSGEPYLLDYLDNIDNVLSNFDKKNYIEEHVNIWKYKK